MLEVTRLNAWYGDAQALFDVSLQVKPGELVVLDGLNGAGKSSLLQSLMGLGPRAQGGIVFAGRDISHLPTHRRALMGLGYVPENRRLFADLTVLENLTVAARPGVSHGQQPDMYGQLEQVFAMFAPLKPLRKRRAAEMSGGEQQMLSIARTLMTAPTMLLLDEPCEGIAPVLVESIRDALLALKAQGLPMLIAEQNALLSDHADRVITLVTGHISRPLSEHNET
ncbi:ABC transporter ATP-binding protein [Rhodoferax sp. GW822-FHT02A01]|uniref:ABC transporter ATP-binding protein n=1 Tax=Rhodoferax sp. GW822-FHT02A01 TaxID=3141537 RepID=UPI00315CFA8B